MVGFCISVILFDIWLTRCQCPHHMWTCWRNVGKCNFLKIGFVKHICEIYRYRFHCSRILVLIVFYYTSYWSVNIIVAMAYLNLRKASIVVFWLHQVLGSKINCKLCKLKFEIVFLEREVRPWLWCDLGGSKSKKPPSIVVQVQKF